MAPLMRPSPRRVAAGPHGQGGIHTQATSRAYLVAVVGALEGPLNLHADVVRLLLRELRELGTQGWEVQPRDLLVQLLGEEVDIILVCLRLLPVLHEVKLC